MSIIAISEYGIIGKLFIYKILLHISLVMNKFTLNNRKRNISKSSGKGMGYKWCL